MSDQPDQEPARDFSAFLLEQAKGHTHRELSEGLRDLVAQVKDTGKRGAMTLTISVKPMSGSPNQVIVEDSINLKLPEHDRPASLFFIGRDGDLQRNDPDQPALFAELAEAPTPRTALVDLDTGEIQETNR